jgi:outer membrane protein assembly factor BamB
MDMFLAKYNGNGNVIWVKGVSATSYGHFIASSAVASDNFGNAYVTGNQSGDTVAFDADTIKSIYSTVFLAKSGSGPTGINPITKSPNSIIVYPNPSNSHFTFELSSNIQATTIDIYNLMGQEISSYSINQSTLLYTINMGNNSSGLYIYRVINKNGESIQEGKLLLEN